MSRSTEFEMSIMTGVQIKGSLKEVRTLAQIQQNKEECDGLVSSLLGWQPGGGLT
jgi:hypothetical protein